MAGDDTTGYLERALAAFEQHDEPWALGLLLMAWWESRSEHLAALLERLSARIDAWPLPSRMGLPSAPLQEVSRDYFILMAYARDGNLDAVIRQLGMLGYGSPDPRLTPVLMEISRLPVGRERPVVQGLCRPLLFLRDSRTLELLRALSVSRHVEREHADALKALIEQLTSKPPPPLDAKASALAGALKAALDARAEAEVASAPLREELLARVYSRPDDEGARLVLADHLLEQGDAAGEFIVLQCSPHPDTQRIWDLQGTHKRTWEAPLGPYIHDGLTRFERGFPVAVRMNFDLVHSPAVPVPAGPAWGTVRELSWNQTLTQAALDTSLAWLKSPHLHGVTEMRHVHAEIALRLRDYPLRVRRLELRGDSRLSMNLFAGLCELESLTRVDISDATPLMVRECAASPLARRLERFTAFRHEGWSVEATPATATVEAKLEDADRVETLAEAIQSATGFGNQVLRVHSSRRLGGEGRRLLERAASSYARVEWP